MSLLSSFHPHTNGQTERDNQDLEATLHCMSAPNPALWSTQLLCIEYDHNSLTSTSTGMLLLNDPCVIRLLGSLVTRMTLLYLPFQPNSCDVTRSGGSSTGSCFNPWTATDTLPTPIPTSNYQLDQKVWLSSSNIPLKTDSRKLIPCYIGTYEIEHIINLSTVS